MRNFSRGNFRNNNSNFSRNDRRSERGGRGDFRSGDPYKRPSDKNFGRGPNDRKPRRDRVFDSPRSSHIQDRRDGPRSYGGRDRSLTDRFKPQRFFRDQSPPRSRDYDNRSTSRHRSNEGRFRRSPPPTPSSFNRRNDLKTRSGRGGIASRRGTRPAGRITSKNDLRSGLIAKRSDPAQRSKEYIKKIRQARLKLSERSQKSLADDDDDDDEPKTPPRENEKETKTEDNDEVLDVANDVNFEEDEDDVAARALKSDDKEKIAGEKAGKGEKSDKKSSDMDVSGTSEKSKRREKSPSKELDRSCSFDLNCVHCNMTCTNIQDYRKHQNRRDHLLAMKKVSIKARMTLNKLRKVQRERQLEIEARVKNVENIPSKYCQVCKLYFRQTKAEHKESEDHKKIRNFLKPWCKICNLHFVGPMKYEIHKCSVNHLRKKARISDPTVEDVADIGDVDLSEYKTVDSIGDVDGEEVESAIEDDDYDEAEASFGQEFINKVEVNYCSLCREYLSRGSKDEKAIDDHCKSKKHLKWYFQSKKKEAKEISSALANAKKAEETASSSKDEAAKPSTSDASKTAKKHNPVDDEIKAAVKDLNPNEDDEDEDDDKNNSKSQDDEVETSDKSKKFTR